MRECYRVLRPGGRMFVASHAGVKARGYLFRNRLVRFRVEGVRVVAGGTGTGKEVYLYVLRKDGDGGEGDEVGDEDGRVDQEGQGDGDGEDRQQEGQ